MNSLNRIKTDKSACHEMTAPFRAVLWIKRGGLPLRIPCLALIFLCGCASMATVKLEPTDTTRNVTTTEKSATTSFQVRQQPDVDNPNMGIAVLQQVTQEQAFQRRHVEKRVLKPGARPLLILTGAALAAGGYYYFYDQGYVVIGRDLMGLGLLIPLGGGVFAGSTIVGEQWKPESKALPPRTAPAANTPVVASVGPDSWTVQTDAKGLLALDISNLANMVDPGKPLAISVALQENPTQKTTFTVPASIVASYRTPLPAPAPEVEVVEIEPTASPLNDEMDRPTLAIIDFEGLGISEQETRVLTNRLGTHLVQLGAFKIIERGQMQQILKEQDFQMTGCTSNECAVEIGQMVGAQQMLAGSFGRFGSIYTIDMRIIDVTTGGILRTTSYDVQGEAERLLTVGLAEAARRIAGID